MLLPLRKESVFASPGKVLQLGVLGCPSGEECKNSQATFYPAEQVPVWDRQVLDLKVAFGSWISVPATSAHH